MCVYIYIHTYAYIYIYRERERYRYTHVCMAQMSAFGDAALQLADHGWAFLGQHACCETRNKSEYR